MVRRASDLGALASDPRWTAPAAAGAVWTDDFTNIISVLELR